ncbi:type I restriction-modification enzyme R subunit C-terminal domain-containing protein [Candidatus Halobeggiatoa sp. HSG11]|nr:type I restriction-modification enzyme R subunit C-terminal domain-containing protein [Candidatus Halobeggiatoa sp. HSG11]
MCIYIDTNRHVIRNLMENGIREATGTHPGKTIIFARNHKHAVFLQEQFDNMYPQYGGKFCRVIDSHDSRSEDLLKEFKNASNQLTIAISVDMLDTGVDVPQIVNLVFARPVYSYVKFWQMIGRGTRLCKDLFGSGQDKTTFRIFDHWGNFKFFEEDYKEADDKPPTKSLLQRLFVIRLQLAKAALQQQNVDIFNQVIGLIATDIAALPTKTIAVKEKLREIKTLQQDNILKTFSLATQNILHNDIAPLMQWRNIRGFEADYQFDELITQTQLEALEQSLSDKLPNESNKIQDKRADYKVKTLGQSARSSDYQGKLIDTVSQLPIQLNQVQDKQAFIQQVKSWDFGENDPLISLETIRNELRHLMQYRQRKARTHSYAKIIDVTEDKTKIQNELHKPKLEGLELMAYRQRVEGILAELFANNQTLQKIKAGEAVSQADLEALVSLVLTQNPDVNLALLTDFYPETRQLDIAIRSIIGLEPAAVAARFADFVQQYHTLTAKQVKFLDFLQNHIAKHGSITLERLYEEPFTTFDSDGIDGIFANDAEIDELLDIIEGFSPPKSTGEYTSK